MKRLKRYFRGVPVGGVCTGTIHFFGLNSKVLLERGVIKPVKGSDGKTVLDYTFAGLDNAGEYTRLSDGYLVRDREAV